MTDSEDDIVAAELALGVLDGEERAQALRRALADPDFARKFERWRDHFGVLFSQSPEVAPPARLSLKIEKSIAPVRRSQRFWPAFALASSAIAAVLAGVLLLQPSRIAAPPTLAVSPSLVASLEPAKGGKVIPAIYDPARQELVVAAAALTPSGRGAELWLIPADGVPRSLGLLAIGARTSVKLSSEQLLLISANATLAVTDEPPGGSPTGKPTGVIVASGSLIPV